MPEGLELPEGHHEHGGENPLLIPVSVSIAVLAVIVAFVTLLGHRAHTEELLLQSKATDQWAYYQAKNIRLHEMQTNADVFSTLAVRDEQQAAAMEEKYKKEVERYAGDKEDISDKAKELEAESQLIGRKADRYDGGEGLLHIGLVICSLTLLTSKKFYWYAGMVVGAGGVVFAMTAFLVH